MAAEIASLRAQIADCEDQLASLKRELAAAEAKSAQHIASPKAKTSSDPAADAADAPRWPLRLDEYERYGRQMILPEIGLEGQLRLKTCKVLVIGVGGLGCPAAAYLAGAGVGTLGLVDGDEVEQSNLHRQILHNMATVGVPKVESAREYIRRLNPLIATVPHIEALSPETALPIIGSYDLVLDCTDTPATRYLISDACVLLGKPLVTASALRADGQLAVLNWPPLPPGVATGGPCYRCVFPVPPPPEAVTSCGEGGVLGPAVGTMGVLQAMEAIKLVTSFLRVGGLERWHHQADGAADRAPANSMLLFSGFSSPPFRSIRLRPRRANCKTCSSTATVTAEALRSGSMDYVQFCGGLVGPVNALKPDERIRAQDLDQLRRQAEQYVLVDVREKVQFGLCNLDGSINIPWSEMAATRPDPPKEPDPDTSPNCPTTADWVMTLQEKSIANQPIYVVCRLGNDSQLAVGKMREFGLDNGGTRWIGDVVGGLRSWTRDVDQAFPEY